MREDAPLCSVGERTAIFPVVKRCTRVVFPALSRPWGWEGKVEWRVVGLKKKAAQWGKWEVSKMPEREPESVRKVVGKGPRGERATH
jgi:hypothetical protein